MTKRILSILLCCVMMIGGYTCSAFADVGNTVTVIAGTGGKVSDDGGNTWTDRVTVTVPNGEMIGDRITYQADEGYALDSITSCANIASISAGKEHTVIIDDNGQVYTSGSNSYGQRAVGDLNSLTAFQTATWYFSNDINGLEGINVKAVSAGQYHTVVLSEDGDVYTTGRNNNGQLGRIVNTRDNKFVKVDVGDGTVKFKAIAASKEYNSNNSNKVGHTVLVDENGKIWTAGGNTFFQLGRTLSGTSIDAKFEQVSGNVNNVEIVDVAAGEVQTIALDSTGHVWITGDDYDGANGLNGSRSRVFTQCPVDGDPKITDIAAGSKHTVLLDENGNVYVTGLNNYGQLGLGDTTKRKVFTKVTLPEGVKIVSIAAGPYCTILVDEDGKVYAAGQNNYGQLGLPLETANTDIFTPVTINSIGECKIVSVATGEDHTVLLDDAGRIWTAGRHNNFQLGRLVDPYKESNSDFELAMDSPVLKSEISSLADFTVTGSCKVTVNFKEKEKVNVSYDLNGGSWASGFTAPGYYYKGDSFTPPELTNVVKAGYNATAWTKSVQSDTEEYSISWEEKSDFTIKFDTGEGGNAIADKTGVKWTDKVLDGITNPTRNGFEFNSWKYGDTIATEETTYAELAEQDSVSSITLTVQWNDITAPSIMGLENDKVYCGAVEFTVSDNDGVESVTVNDNPISPQADGKYVLSPASGEQTVVVKDNANNSSIITVTVNDGHTPKADDGDCTTAVRCVYCDEIAVAAKMHDFTGEWQKDDTHHWHVCGNEGCTVTDTKIEHSGVDDNDCTTAVTCECGKIIKQAQTEHNWSAWTQNSGAYTHTHSCQNTDCTVSDTKACSGGEATCIQQAVCEFCHNPYRDKNPDNHTGEKQWTQTRTDHEQKWSCCGVEVVAKEPHEWENGVCKECGYRYSYTPTVQKPEITIIGEGKATLSTDGRTATITPDEGYELVSITLNGKDIANTNKLTGLKTGDKVVITFQKKSEEPPVDTKTIVEKVSKMKLTARSSKTTKKNIKITVKTDKETNNLIKEIEDLGYTVKYKYYRSTKKSSEYGERLEKDYSINSYINTTGKKGTRYYYRVKVMVYDADGNLVANTELKQCKYAARMWSK